MAREISGAYLQAALIMHRDEHLSWRRVARVLNGTYKTNYQPSSVEAALRRWGKK